jgi:hypothetical protein
VQSDFVDMDGYTRNLEAAYIEALDMKEVECLLE